MLDALPFSISPLSAVATVATLTAVWTLKRLFTVPDSLRHLPCVPLLPLIRSYASMESEDKRIHRLVLPFANEHNEKMVVVWAAGQWMVHVLDPKLFAEVSSGINTFLKQPMSEDALISRFFGSSNVIWTNGDDWKRQTAILRNAFNTIPVDVFVGLCKNLFEVIESTQTHSLSQPSPSDPLPLYSEKSPHADSSHTVDWSDLSQRLTLDAVGCSIMGYNYDSLRTASPFVTAYNRLMEDIAHPLYLMLPALERILPRKEANARMEKLSRELCELLNAKRKDPGQDIMTFMVNDPELTSKELQDNMTALFLAGHDTTTSVLATLVYYLARHPEIQSKAREEVTRVFASHGVSEPEDISVVTSQSLPYLTACVKETMRIQPPGTYITPRISPGVVLGGQYIPPGVLIVPNIYAIHHSSAIWRDPDVFRPERFTESPSTSASTTGATFGSANGVGSSGREPWLPFSSGPRVCPAHNFSQYELRIIAAMLLLRYEWRLPPGSSHADRLKNAFSSLGMLIPEHLDITFTRRADSVIGR